MKRDDKASLSSRFIYTKFWTLPNLAIKILNTREARFYFTRPRGCLLEERAAFQTEFNHFNDDEFEKLKIGLPILHRTQDYLGDPNKSASALSTLIKQRPYGEEGRAEMQTIADFVLLNAKNAEKRKDTFNEKKRFKTAQIAILWLKKLETLSDCHLFTPEDSQFDKLCILQAVCIGQYDSSPPHVDSPKKIFKHLKNFTFEEIRLMLWSMKHDIISSNLQKMFLGNMRLSIYGAPSEEVKNNVALNLTANSSFYREVIGKQFDDPEEARVFKESLGLFNGSLLLALVKFPPDTDWSNVIQQFISFLRQDKENVWNLAISKEGQYILNHFESLLKDLKGFYIFEDIIELHKNRAEFNFSRQVYAVVEIAKNCPGKKDEILNWLKQLPSSKPFFNGDGFDLQLLALENIAFVSKKIENLTKIELKNFFLVFNELNWLHEDIVKSLPQNTGYRYSHCRKVLLQLNDALVATPGLVLRFLQNERKKREEGKEALTLDQCLEKLSMVPDLYKYFPAYKLIRGFVA